MEAQERKNKFEKVPNTEFQIQENTDWVDKAPRPSISNVIWVLSSDNIYQINQLFSNSEVAMLSMTEVLTVGNAESVIESNQSKPSESQN